MDQVLPSHCLAANLALDALRVVGFLPQLDTVPFDQVLADDAGVLEFLKFRSQFLVAKCEIYMTWRMFFTA